MAPTQGSTVIIIICLHVAMTLEGKTVLKEGWITLYKGKKPGIFSTKQVVSCNTV